MNAKKYSILFGVVLIGVVAVIYFNGFSKKEDVYDVQRIYTFNYEIKNTTNKAIKNIDIQLDVPVAKNGSQDVDRIDSSKPYEVISDQSNNQTFKYHFDVLAPYENKLLTLKTKVAMAAQPNQTELDDKDAYLVESPLIETRDKEIRTIATYLFGETDRNTLENIYDYVRQNMTYSGFLKEDKGALYAMQNKTGDCTEYAHLVAALARVNNIPARIVEGYFYDKNMNVKPEDFHSWTEVYIDGAWLPIDALYENFLTKSENYLAITIRPRDTGKNKKVPGLVVGLKGA